MGEDKIIKCIVGKTMREIVDKANKLEIKKEDIVQIIPMNGYLYLVYYK